MSEFIDFVWWLNKEKIQYIIPWGYETLPTPSGGDVDVCVSYSDYNRVANELIRHGYAVTNCTATHVKHIHGYFTRPDSYTIDMFTSFCFAYKGKTTVLNIDPKYFLASRVWERDYWIATPAVEALFTSLRILGGRGDCVKRLEKYLE